MNCRNCGNGILDDAYPELGRRGCELLPQCFYVEKIDGVAVVRRDYWIPINRDFIDEEEMTI